MEKRSAVYQIINTVTGDRYVGSSRDVERRWLEHKRPSAWKKHPNSQMYKDMQKYGTNKFRFLILAPVMEEYLKDVEQEFIDMLKPTYNKYRANELDVEGRKAANRARQKKYRQSDKGKAAQKKYWQSEKGKASAKAHNKKWRQSEKGKETKKGYDSQLCNYNGETLTLDALRTRFRRAGIEHPTLEAKKYLLR